jgi:glutathionylspermidine synthase
MQKLKVPERNGNTSRKWMETAYLNRLWLKTRIAKEMWEDRGREGIIKETGTR